MNGIKGRLGYLGALSMVCGRATSRAFTSQAVQLNSHEFRRASSRRIYIGPFTEAILLPLFPPCATRRGLGIWATPALSLVLTHVCVCRRRLWRRLNEWYCGTFPIPSLVQLERLSNTHRNSHSATFISTWTSLRLRSTIYLHPKKHAHRPTNPSQVKRNELTPRPRGSPQTTLRPHALGAQCGFPSANRKWALEMARTCDRPRSTPRHLGCWLSLALQLLSIELTWVDSAPATLWAYPTHRQASPTGDVRFTVLPFLGGATDVHLRQSARA